MDEIIKDKLKSEIERADKVDDRFTSMEENEEFMDGEEIYNSGFARGRLFGLQMALRIIEEAENECVK